MRTASRKHFYRWFSMQPPIEMEAIYIPRADLQNFISPKAPVCSNSRRHAAKISRSRPSLSIAGISSSTRRGKLAGIELLLRVGRVQLRAREGRCGSSRAEAESAAAATSQRRHGQCGRAWRSRGEAQGGGGSRVRRSGPRQGRLAGGAHRRRRQHRLCGRS